MRGREAIIAVGESRFSMGESASVAKKAQAAAPPGPLRCLGDAVRTFRTVCKALPLASCIEIATIEPQGHCTTCWKCLKASREDIFPYLANSKQMQPQALL